ncbi:hypothetical protein DY000_02039716 [Brassica cretica]|uniref:Uncharacterized protein n=1 Tax=Brassica cretica TaxID=69181 RepID=A0ABQ7B5L5_BRACR|nr:hypothetical protein DY000_02039716 [Brassica cretica]
MITQFLHSELLAAVRGLAKWSKSGMGTSSCSLGQGCWSRTGGGGGAVLVVGTEIHTVEFVNRRKAKLT